MEKQPMIEPRICEQTKKNLWNKIASERAEQRLNISKNYDSIVSKLQEVYSKDRSPRATQQVVFSSK